MRPLPYRTQRYCGTQIELVFEISVRRRSDATPFSVTPSIVRLRNSWLISGSTVFVRIASIMRPPLSTSVQRLTINFTASSS